VSLKGISVVMPNYNGRYLLEQTLPDLFVALKNSGSDYEVIIPDDRSTDDSVVYLEQAFSSVIIIKSEANQGFSTNTNKGIFAAKYDHVLILNSDVKLSPNYFDSLYKYFDDPDTFGVMGRIIGWEDEQIQDGAKFPAYHGAKIKTSGNYYATVPDVNDRLYSMYLSGANAFVDRKKLLLLGGFDELFSPFYVEDFEMSLRAWRVGWKCYYDHFAVCRHQVSVSIKSKSSKNFVNTIYYRNKMFLHAMHLSPVKLVLWYLQLIPETLIRLFTGRFYYFASLKMFFSSFKKMKASEEKFAALVRRRCIDLSVQQVTDKILDSLKGKDITRF
jgi:GT2 family glycosyltransferase